MVTMVTALQIAAACTCFGAASVQVRGWPTALWTVAGMLHAFAALVRIVGLWS